MIDDKVVQAKLYAAEELAVESHMSYKMYAGSKITHHEILI